MASEHQTTALREVTTDLWVAEQPLGFFGIDVGCRMSCIRLREGVALHSPIELQPQLQEAVARIGEVRWLIAPNRFHHLFVSDWAQAHPDAEVFIAPGLRKKRADLAAATDLSETVTPWGRDLATVRLRGAPAMDEFVFFHSPSATLVITDLAFHFGAEAPWATRLMIRISGRLGELAPTRLERFLIKDRQAFRSSLERVLEWPFERVVVAHGTILESGGREALAKGYGWLLR